MKSFINNATTLKSARVFLLIGSVLAGDVLPQTFYFTVTTIPNMSVEQVQPLSFGNNILTTQGTSCTVAVDDNNQTLVSGDGCGVDNCATFGVFKINGISNSTIMVKLMPSDTASGFSFTPNKGRYIDQTQTAQEINGSEFTVGLDDNGVSELFIGGTLRVQQQLPYDTLLEASYVIKVIY